MWVKHYTGLQRFPMLPMPLPTVVFGILKPLHSYQ